MNNTQRLQRTSGLFTQWSARAERGEDESYEFTVVIVPIVVMILLIAFATVVRAAQMPVWAAASACAREAIASADETIGRNQGERAAWNSLNGNVINASAVQVVITGTWAPNTPVTCQVSYNIDVSGIVGFNEMTGGSVPMSAQVTLRTEPYKSRWR
jgi:Flp pilus assembly protein TadG